MGREELSEARVTAMAAPKARKRRDLKATRAAVLQAARICFSADSYDHVSLRQIAGLANVDVAMVSRTYGSKKELYRAAVVSMFHFPEDFAKLPTSQMVDAMIDWLVLRDRVKDFDVNLAMIRSASVSPARELLREGLEERFVAPLADLIDKHDATLRSELISAIALGLLTLRDVVESSKLRAADPAELRRLLRPILMGLVG